MFVAQQTMSQSNLNPNPNPMNTAVEFMDQKFLIERHTIMILYMGKFFLGSRGIFPLQYGS